MAYRFFPQYPIYWENNKLLKGYMYVYSHNEYVGMLTNN